MGGLNKVQVIGNIGRDSELKYTNGGSAVINFSVAVNESWKDKDGKKQERTEWVKCILFGKRAEGLHKYLTKGKQVYVEGRMATRMWEDKQGVKHYTTEVVLDDVVMLGGKRDASAVPSERPEGPGSPMPEDSFSADDDIPF